jgi:rod shape-determining protein MreD
LTIVLLLALYEFVLFWVDGAAGRTVPVTSRWAPTLSGAVLWLIVWSLFDTGRRDAHERL